MRLTPEDHARIRAAIEAAERRTSGEIFCVLADRVSSYRDVSLGWATAAALLLPLVLIPLGFEAAWLPGVADSWQTAHLAAQQVEVGQTLAAYSVLQAAVLIAVFLITSVPVVNRWVTPGVVRQARVRRAALQQFLAHGLQDTEQRTSSVTKTWSMRMAGKLDGKVLSDGRCPASRWASRRCLTIR